MPSKALGMECLSLTLPLLIPKLGPQGSMGSCPSQVQLGPHLLEEALVRA